MNNFFAGVGKIPFKMFGPIHIALIVILLILIVLIYIYRNRLKKFKHNKVLRYILAAILLLNMIIYYLGMYFTKTLSVVNNSPLHLCFLANFALIYILLSGDKKLYKIIYYIIFIGPLPAIIWTNLDYAFDTYVFYQFIICHHVMLLINIYLLFVMDYKVNFKDIFKAFGVVVIYLIIISIINNLIGANYMMLKELPKEILVMYPFLKKVNPIIPLIGAGVIALAVSYIPVYIINRKKLGE